MFLPGPRRRLQRVAEPGPQTEGSTATKLPVSKQPKAFVGQVPLESEASESGPAGKKIICMHIVLVLVTVKPELLAEFEQALLHNARESVARDPGCLRFDVSQQQDDPARWVLYEVYDSPDAHAAHRRSPHFLAYDAVAARALVDKTVIRASGRHTT